MYEEMDLINLISNIGFPIVVSIYLLLRFERKLEGLAQAIQQLAKVVEYTSKKE